MLNLVAVPADDVVVWWHWVVVGVFAWLVLATLFGVVVGRGIRMADRGAPDSRYSLGTASPPSASRTPASAIAPGSSVGAAPRVRRRAVPLPPVGVGLAAVAVALMVADYVSAVTGASASTAAVLSAEAAMSLPRLYVTGLLAAAALVAAVGAVRDPGRRAWWLAVGLVAAGIGASKASGDAPHRAVATAIPGGGDLLAPALGALVALGALGTLWVVSRKERRDRRRVLGSLAGYAVATVGLSEVSRAMAATPFGATAAFLEHSGEALAGIALFVAVLVGVAPRLALPADWGLRRTADAHVLEPVHSLPGPAADPTP